MSPSPFALGVGGHQHLGGEETQQFVARQFREQLASIQQREQHLVLYAALARGADQLFVQIALELGVPVEIVIPCTHYEQIFSSEAEQREYRRLLHAGQASHQLPAHICSDDAFLAAGQWIIDHCDLAILAWNGLPPQGRGGTGDMASYARSLGRPFVHIDTRHQTVKTYPGSALRQNHARATSPKRTDVISKRQLYQGSALTINQYHLQMPDGEEVVRDVVERPDSVLVIPLGQSNIVLLIEEYNFGAGLWQLTLPGGKVEASSRDNLDEQAQKELRQEIGYRANRLEKFGTFSSHPGYISHHVHVFIAHDLEWDPLEFDPHEEISVQTFTIKEALEATSINNRCDPEAALALWLYAQKEYNFTAHCELDTDVR